MNRRPFHCLARLLIAAAFLVSSLAPAYADINMETADHDVAQSIMNARLAMRDVAECNLEMLARIDGILAREQNNLMRLQGWVFSKLQQMAEQLNNIFSDMENMMQKPMGNERVALETLKSGLSATGLIPGFGAIAYGASLGIQAGEMYAQWHNSSQAAGIADGIKKNAQKQVEAFQGAVDLYNQIVQALPEIAQNRAKIQQLMATYEERCLKKPKPGGGPQQHGMIPSPAGTAPSGIENAVDTALVGLNDCDLPKLVAANAFLTAQIDNLFNQQQKLFGDLLKKSFELNNALSQLEKGLPQPPNLGWEGIKAGLGSVGLSSNAAVGMGSFGVGLGTQIADMQDSLNGLKASEALKGPARQKMQELQELVRKHEEILNTLIRVRKEQERIQKLIETWEERCNKQKDNAIGALPDNAMTTSSSASSSGANILIASDGTTWCTYGYGSPTAVPVKPTGGGTLPPSAGSSGGTAIPAGIPSGTTPGGSSAPTPQPTGSTPEDKPQPTVSSSGGTFIPLGPTVTPTPTGSTPKPQPAESGPRLTVKARQSVLDAGGGTQQAVAGQQIKLFADSTVAQALPNTKGAKKNDADFDQEPMQCTTGKDGTCNIPLPSGTFTGTAPNMEANVDVGKQASVNVQAEKSAIPDNLKPYITNAQWVNGKTYVTLTYPAGMDKQVKAQLKGAPGINQVETNYCRDKQPGPVRFRPFAGGIPSQTVELKEAL